MRLKRKIVYLGLAGVAFAGILAMDRRPERMPAFDVDPAAGYRPVFPDRPDRKLRLGAPQRLHRLPSAAGEMPEFIGARQPADNQLPVQLPAFRTGESALPGTVEQTRRLSGEPEPWSFEPGWGWLADDVLALERAASPGDLPRAPSRSGVPDASWPLPDPSSGAFHSPWRLPEREGDLERSRAPLRPQGRAAGTRPDPLFEFGGRSGQTRQDSRAPSFFDPADTDAAMPGLF